MADNCIDHLIVYSEDPHLSEYTGECDRYRAVISKFTGSAGILLVSADSAFLWTDSRYHVQAKEQLDGTGITLMKYGLPGVPSIETYLSEHIWDGQTVAFDHMTVSYEEYKDILSKLPDSVDVVDGAKILRTAVPDLPKRTFCAVDLMPEESAGLSCTDKISILRSKIQSSYAHDKSYTYIISDMTAVMWLFNLRGSDISYVPVAYSYALVTDHTATLYVSRKDILPDAVSYLEASDVAIRPYSSFYDDLDDIATDIVIADSYKNNARILKRFDDDGIYKDCSDTELIPKHIKNKAETEGMKSAHIKDAVTVIRFIRKIKDAAKREALSDEYETGGVLDKMRLDNGCDMLSFKTICAYGKNGAVVHYTARPDSALNLQSKGFLLVDSGGQYRFEGTTDITRTISLGKLSDEEKKVYTAVLKGNLRLMDAYFPEGYKGALLDMTAESPLWEIGCFCGHGIGHGVGHYLSVHESEARISRSSGVRESAFFPGVIVSDEPGVYIEGKFGVRLETLLLTVAAEPIGGNKMCRFEPLTLVPFDKEAIDMDMLSDNDIRILRDYYDLIWEKVSPFLDEDEKTWLKEIIDIN